MFEIVLSPEALEFYTEADAPLARKLNRCFEQLRSNPRSHNNIKRLTGEFGGLLRFRVGDWRVIYEIEDHERRVVVLSIAHRKEAYE